MFLTMEGKWTKACFELTYIARPRKAVKQEIVRKLIYLFKQRLAVNQS